MWFSLHLTMKPKQLALVLTLTFIEYSFSIDCVSLSKKWDHLSISFSDKTGLKLNLSFDQVQPRRHKANECCHSLVHIVCIRNSAANVIATMGSKLLLPLTCHYLERLAGGQKISFKVMN